MLEVRIYEDGDTYSYYRDCTKNAIALYLENDEFLQQLIKIVIQSGHSIEIEELVKNTKGE